MSTIIVYSASGAELHHEQYPADWTFAALQKIARSFVRGLNGQRYAIISAGQRYDSAVRKGAGR